MILVTVNVCTSTTATGHLCKFFFTSLIDLNLFKDGFNFITNNSDLNPFVFLGWTNPQSSTKVWSLILDGFLGFLVPSRFFENSKLANFYRSKKLSEVHVKQRTEICNRVFSAKLVLQKNFFTDEKSFTLTPRLKCQNPHYTQRNFNFPPKLGNIDGRVTIYRLM